MPSTIRLHRVLATSTEKLYRAFLEADALAKWLPPDGFTCTVHEFEARADGRFRMSFRNFTTGAFFSEAALAAAAYVLFLAFAFHGPARWSANQAEFGFFVDHFTFIAGLLLAAVHGTGERVALRWRLLGGGTASAGI